MRIKALYGIILLALVFSAQAWFPHELLHNPEYCCSLTHIMGAEEQMNCGFNCNFIRWLHGHPQCVVSKPLSFIFQTHSLGCGQCIFNGRNVSCLCQGPLLMQPNMEDPVTHFCCYYHRRGGLQCLDFSNRDLPKGNYHLSCHGCIYDGLTLQCICQGAHRIEQETYLVGANICSRVYNQNGQLVCH